MSNKYIRNMEPSKIHDMKELVEYQEGRVVSLTCVQNNAVSMTLFAFAKDEGISTHSAPGDALVYILDGKAEVTIGEDVFLLDTGQNIVMPAGIPHGLRAVESFKMLLLIFNL